MENLIYLKSVETYLNPQTGILYPVLTNNQPDLGISTSLKHGEFSQEWFDALSFEDLKQVNKVLTKEIRTEQLKRNVKSILLDEKPKIKNFEWYMTYTGLSICCFVLTILFLNLEKFINQLF